MPRKTADFEILRTKLHRPPVGRDIVCRGALYDRLDKGRQLPLMLVSAPAGYGKSTLVSRWLEDCGLLPVPWLPPFAPNQANRVQPNSTPLRVQIRLTSSRASERAAPSISASLSKGALSSMSRGRGPLTRGLRSDSLISWAMTSRSDIGRVVFLDELMKMLI